MTHYIYQGRVGDNTREYRGVKERGLHVVSQYWLHAVCFTIANFKGLNDTLLVKMQTFFLFFFLTFVTYRLLLSVIPVLFFYSVWDVFFIKGHRL